MNPVSNAKIAAPHTMCRQLPTMCRPNAPTKTPTCSDWPPPTCVARMPQPKHLNAPTKTHACSDWVLMCRPVSPTKTHTSSDWVKGDTECQIFAVHTPVLKTDYQHTWNHLRNIPPKIAFVAVFPRLISMPKDVNLCSFRINRRQLAPFACKSLSTHSCATKNKEKTN